MARRVILFAIFFVGILGLHLILSIPLWDTAINSICARETLALGNGGICFLQAELEHCDTHADIFVLGLDHFEYRTDVLFVDAYSAPLNTTLAIVRQTRDHTQRVMDRLCTLPHKKIACILVDENGDHMHAMLVDDKECKSGTSIVFILADYGLFCLLIVASAMQMFLWWPSRPGMITGHSA